MENCLLPVQRITPDDDFHYFFGYYDKCPWNCDERLILAQRSTFMDRDPGASDVLQIGVIDTANKCRFTPITSTRAWNWQQGCMLRWLPGKENDTIVFNDRRDGRFVTVIHSLTTGAEDVIGFASYDIAPKGRDVVTGNFARVHASRPGYGYAGLADPFGDGRAPAKDGIYLGNLATGDKRLIFSLADALTVGKVRPGPEAKTWFNHFTLAPAGQRFVVLHRWASGGPKAGHTGFLSRMLSMDCVGNDVTVPIEDAKISHFTFFDDTRLAVWLEAPQRDIYGYYLVDIITGDMQKIGGDNFLSDGHCNYSPDRRWLLTDRYPVENSTQPLFLYELSSGRCRQIGAFTSITDMNTSSRCDLHSRWNRNSSKICFDSTHEGRRAIYQIDVTPITAGKLSATAAEKQADGRRISPICQLA